MAAPKGNRFWEKRSKHGRDKIFADPDLLWEAACEYFEQCEDNPLIIVEQLKKPTQPIITEDNYIPSETLVELPRMRAFTWEGLELFLDIHSLRDYKTNPNYKDFSQVITRIEKVMYAQKFTGAAAGLLNPNIIARDLGLKDKTDNEHSLKLGKDTIEDIYE